MIALLLTAHAQKQQQQRRRPLPPTPPSPAAAAARSCARTVKRFEARVPFKEAVQVGGPVHRGIKAVDAGGDPAAEPGDGARAEGKWHLAVRESFFSAVMRGAHAASMGGTHAQLLLWHAGAWRACSIDTGSLVHARPPWRTNAGGSSFCPKSEPSAITGRLNTACRGAGRVFEAQQQVAGRGRAAGCGGARGVGAIGAAGGGRRKFVGTARRLQEANRPHRGAPQIARPRRPPHRPGAP